MIAILLVLTAGIIVGLLIVNYPKLHIINNNLLNYAIYLLLFLLGISVGTNREVIQNLDKIGLEAITIAIASISGSVFLSFFLLKLLFNRHEK